MDDLEKITDIVDRMKTSRLANYVIAGLDSYLLENGRIRLFENSRDHQDQITPHTHRFDFVCLVLEGYVTNKVWEKGVDGEGDLFEQSELIYKGEPGSHALESVGRGWWEYSEYEFCAGEIYSMKADEVHSIKFSRGAKVLFFEGPDISNTSSIIEPVVDGKVIRTYENKPYMFEEDGSDDED